MAKNKLNAKVEGFENSYVNSVSSIPAVAVYSIEEFIDNSIDAGASEINITVKDRTLIIEDNGCGMTIDKMYALANNVVVKNPDKDRNSIGRFGHGFHNSVVRNATLDERTKVTVRSTTTKELYETVFTFINKVSSNHVDSEVFIERSIERVEKGKRKQGTTITIENTKEYFDINAIKDRIIPKYNLLADSGLVITVNNEKIPLYDYCYLSKLDKDVEEGVYEDGAITHFVRRPIMNGRPMLIVGILVDKKHEDYQLFSKNDKADSLSTGLYINFNGKLMEKGGQDSWKHLSPKRVSNRGGEGSRRIYIDASAFPEEIGISFDKSQSLPKICEMYKISEDSTGLSLHEYLSQLNTILKNEYDRRVDSTFNLCIDTDEMLETAVGNAKATHNGIDTIIVNADTPKRNKKKSSGDILLAFARVNNHVLQLTFNSAHPRFYEVNKEKLAQRAALYLAASKGNNLSLFNRMFNDEIRLKNALRTNKVKICMKIAPN